MVQFANRKIYVVGRGKAGTWLHQRLCACGYAEKDSLLSGRIPALPSISSEAVTFFIAVPDRFIEETSLAYKKLLPSSEVWFAHLSGAFVTENIATFHPVLSIPNEGESVIENPCVGIEGKADVCEWLNTLAQNIKCNPVMLHSEKKALYHAACVLAGSLNGLYYSELSKIFESVGIESDISKQITKDLLFSSIQNIDRFGVEKGLTGPIVRDDKETQQSNIDALRIDNEQMAKVYKILSQLYLNSSKS